MDLDNYVPFTVQSDVSNLRVRCYQCSALGSVITSLIIAGPEQECVGVFSNMVTSGAILAYDGKAANRCEYRYRRLVAPIQPASLRWVSMLILSKDPRILWQDDDTGLINGLKRLTETPFLDSWIGYIRAQLEKQELLKKLRGVNARGSYLNCNTEELDAIVADGVKQGELRLQGD